MYQYLERNSNIFQSVMKCGLLKDVQYLRVASACFNKLLGIFACRASLETRLLSRLYMGCVKKKISLCFTHQSKFSQKMKWWYLVVLSLMLPSQCIVFMPTYLFLCTSFFTFYVIIIKTIAMRNTLAGACHFGRPLSVNNDIKKSKVIFCRRSLKSLMITQSLEVCLICQSAGMIY